MVTNTAHLKFKGNGTVEIITDSMDLGTGLNTVWRQFVAEGLNISIEKTVKLEVNTDYAPYTSNSFSSMATFHGGYALVNATMNAKKLLFANAAPILNAKPEDLETKDGKIMVKGKPEGAIQWSKAFPVIPGQPGPGEELMVSGGIYAPDDYQGPGKMDPATSQCLGPHFRSVLFHSHQANAAEVWVNKETGEVRVTKWAGGCDLIPANPTNVEGQLEGGSLVMGLGTALTEARWQDKGMYLGKSYLEWKIPTVLDIPKVDNVDTAIVPVWGEAHGENPRIDAPFGAKGTAEGVQAPTAPCIANAITDAIGVRLTTIPFTPDVILKALGKA
jgi:carbon-monoxide dehydrogenase large subunit